MAQNFKIFSQTDPEYWLSLILRYKILRHPLGLTYSMEDLKKESNDFHLGLFSGSKLLACQILTPVSDKKIKLRQVAVDDTVQGMGYGSQLQKHCEEFAKKKGFEIMFCHARKVAVPFYEKAGFVVSGEEFQEVGIPHYYMEKNL